MKHNTNGLKAVIFSAVLLPVTSFADLKSLNDADMSATTAQSAITIGLDLVLNKKNNSNADLKDCLTMSGDCQLGVRFDNQNNSNLWLTLTGVSGGLKVPKTTVESVDVTSNGVTSPGIKITSGNTKTDKVVFSDFGFDSIRLSADKLVDGQVSGGYRNAVPFGQGLDAGRQPGFVGMRINGAVEMTGSVTIFNCTSC